MSPRVESKQYHKVPTPDLYERIKDIEQRQDHLRKGIAYLNERINTPEDPSWAQNIDEWKVFKQANRRYLALLETQKTTLYNELRDRAIKTAGKQQSKQITSLQASLTALQHRLEALGSSAA